MLAKSSGNIGEDKLAVKKLKGGIDPIVTLPAVKTDRRCYAGGLVILINRLSGNQRFPSGSFYVKPFYC
jgi:hypothetical protein